MNMLFFHLIYTNMRLIYRICPYMVSATLMNLYTSYWGTQTNLVMAQNPKSENNVRSLQQWYPKYLEHLFNAISYNPGVHSGTSYLVNYIQYIWQLTRKWVNTQPLRFLSKLNLGPKYTEHIFNVIWLNLPRHSLGHELRQITKLRR